MLLMLSTNLTMIWRSRHLQSEYDLSINSIVRKNQAALCCDDPRISTPQLNFIIDGLRYFRSNLSLN